MLFGLAPARPETTPRGQASVAEAPPATRFLLEGSMYQVQMTCACGEKYWPTQKWIHKECGVVNPPQTVTTATNRIATNTSATNGERDSERNPKTVGVHDGGDYRGGGTSEKTANRRSREAYNAYQREYMRRKRK
jgi:hypothetical protein